FDQLAGTGAAGRRALMEAEYHLRTAAAGAMARGLPEDQAEHEAVSRFGRPALVARKMRSAQGAARLNRAVSTTWLLAGLACCGRGDEAIRGQALARLSLGFRYTVVPPAGSPHRR